eukprot:TRINITY_DN4169_c0_g1_i1.p1 TRINITY_DN4169_c0_g1~~TRINITY_DN4169_c0_g1_i1.p1  ORF type:complete len:137 (-),score=26.71 TRINITY_DN4169_c0_g1_i1:776-1186(-)
MELEAVVSSGCANCGDTQERSVLFNLDAENPTHVKANYICPKCNLENMIVMNKDDFLSMMGLSGRPSSVADASIERPSNPVPQPDDVKTHVLPNEDADTIMLKVHSECAKSSCRVQIMDKDVVFVRRMHLLNLASK